jgi:hypothetical protein
MQIFLKLFIRDYEKAKKVLRIHFASGDPQYVYTWNSIDFLSEAIDTYPREVLTLKSPIQEDFDLEGFESHAAELSKTLDCLVETPNGYYKNGTFIGKDVELSASDILAAVVQFRKIHLQFVIDQRCQSGCK